MGMAENLKRGTIELVLLTLLSEDDMYGYQLSHELAERSEDLFVLQEGSMYPTLYRLLEKGLISDRNVRVGKRRTRVYYHIEDEGRAYLEQIRREYFSMTYGVMKVLKVDHLDDQYLTSAMEDGKKA